MSKTTGAAVWAAARDQETDEPRGASRGQVMIMFALFAMAMFGVLGLAIDLGYSFAERRTVQNAADLAAVAGARAIARYSNSTTSPVTTYALTDMNAALAGNEMGGITPTIKADSCFYIDYSAVPQAACATSLGAAIGVPESASGVRLTVEATHRTFFIRVFPGAPSRVTVTASARAFVERSQNGGFNSPILICGYGNKTWPANEAIDILSNNTTVNPNAIGKTFRLTGTKTQIPRCGTDGSAYSSVTAWNSWRGATYRTKNKTPANEVDASWYLYGGTPAELLDPVIGIEGCKQGTAAPYNCIIPIPIACGTAQGCTAPAGTGTDADPLTMYVIKILAFRVERCSGTTGTACLQGTLLDDYLLSEMTYPGGGGWTRDSGGVVGIKLNKPDSSSSS